MSSLRLSDSDAAALRAVLLLQRYSLGLNRVADGALGDREADSIDVQLLVTIGSADGISPSGVVAALGRPRSTVSRSLARLQSGRLVERRTHPVDRRRAELHLTSRGRDGIARFEQALSDFFDEGGPLIKEVLLLLGRDPEAVPQARPRPSVLELADRMSAADATYAQDVIPRMRALGVVEFVDRFALTVLAHGSARPSWLADELGLSPAGTTSLLERLEVAGLVVRESGALESDRRAVMVRLTPRGRRAARVQLSVFRAHQEALLDAVEPTLGIPRAASA